MKNLIIIGARGFGRAVAWWAKSCRGHGSEFRLKGFLDDNAAALDGYDIALPILGSPQTYAIEKDDVFVCALGEPKWKKHYVEMIAARGGEFISLVHEMAFVGERVQVGKGCIFLAGIVLAADIRLGNFVTLQPYSSIGHDSVVGDYVHMNTHGFVGGYAVLGEGATIHAGGKVLPQKKVGDWGVVGAGAVVLRDVKAHTTVAGVPATEL